MAVYWTPVRPEPLLSNSLILLRDQMLDALRTFEVEIEQPLENGYENRLRNFVFNELHDNIPDLFNGGVHIYYGDGFYQADLLIGEDGAPLPNHLNFNFMQTQHILQDIIEWGHDHAIGVNGCVNKPFADFIKWFVLMDPRGRFHFNPLPICCFQIATDFTGTDCYSINRIRRAFYSLHFLTDIWDIDYDHHPAHAYIFMNYFPAGIDFHELLSALPNPFYADDLTANYTTYREANPGWPITLSIDNGISALDAILDL